MGAKVTFDPVTFEIEVTAAPSSGVISLDFKVDVYSDGKEDWRVDDELIKQFFPIRAVGGDPLSGSLNLDTVFFLAAPWQILPYDGDHSLEIVGNLFRDVGSSLPLVKARSGRTVLATVLQTFSAGAAASGSLTASQVWDEARALTVGKFLALKEL